MTKEEVIRELESLDEFKLLEKVVKEQITVQDAFRHILKLTMNQLSIYGPEDWNKFGTPDWNVCRAIVELAQRLEPSEQTKLVEFMYHVQKQVAVDPSTNEPLKAEGAIFWTDMPSFGYTELEEWEEYGGAQEDPTNPRMYYKERNRWTKLNAFLAQLTGAADVHYPSSQEEPLYHPLDKSGRAIWTISKALENDRPPAWLRNTAAMEATCYWFIYAAEHLWDIVLHNDRWSHLLDIGTGKRYVLKGWKGIPMERWMIWENAMKDTRDACEDGRVRNLLDDAVASITRAMGNL